MRARRPDVVSGEGESPLLEDPADRGVIQVRDPVRRRDPPLQQPQRPAPVPLRGLGAGQGDHPGLHLVGHLGLHRRLEPDLATDRIFLSLINFLIL